MKLSTFNDLFVRFNVYYFDLDETLYSARNKLKIPKSSLEFLFERRKTGVVICYSTGRNLESAIEVIKLKALPQPDFLVTDLGSHIIDFQKNTTHKIKPLNKEWNLKIIDKILSSNPRLKERKADRSSEFKRSFYVESGANHENLKKTLVKKLRAAGQKTRILIVSEKYLYVLPEGVNKAEALKYIINLLNVSLDSVIVAGDSEAEMELFKECPFSIVTAGAKYAVIKATNKLNPKPYHPNLPYLKGVIEGIVYFEKSFYKTVKNNGQYYKNKFPNVVFYALFVNVENKIKQGKFSSALLELNKGLSWFKNIHSPLMLMGDLYRSQIEINLGELTKAKKRLTYLLKNRFKSPQFKVLEFEVYNQLLYLLRLEGNYKNCDKLLLNMQKLSRTTAQQQSFLHAVAGLYRDQGLYKLALKFYQKEHTAGLLSSYEEARVLNNIGFCLRKMNKFVLAMQYYKKALRIEKSHHFYNLEARTINNIGGIYRERGEYSRALSYFGKSADLRRILKDEVGLSSSLFNLGHTAWLQGNHHLAMKNLSKSLAIRKKTGSLKLIQEVLNLLEDVNRKTNQT